MGGEEWGEKSYVETVFTLSSIFYKPKIVLKIASYQKKKKSAYLKNFPLRLFSDTLMGL